MDNFFRLLPNLTLPLHLVWLYQRIIDDKPVTLRVLCTELCAGDAMLQLYADHGIPWSVHNDAATLPPALSWDTVLIQSNDHQGIENAIQMASEIDNAYRAHYLIVYNGLVNHNTIEDVAVFARALGLLHISIIRLEDRTIFSSSPKCHLAQVTEVPTITWPELTKLDFNNCTVRVAIAPGLPFYTFEGDDDSTLNGIWAPFFRYAQSKLGFRAVLVKCDYVNLSDYVLSGQTDMLFNGVYLKPDMPLFMTNVFTSVYTWCVPNSCAQRDSSNLLWEEFPGAIWGLLAVSVLAVGIALRLMAPSPGSTTGTALLVVLSALTSTAVKLPRGHARWPLSAWLLASLILGCCYQTVLHSMMTAPRTEPRIQDVEGISISKMEVACSFLSCPALRSLEFETAAETDLAARVKEVKDLSRLTSSQDDQRLPAVFTSSVLCESQLTKMRPLQDYQLKQVIIALFGVLPSSWLAPALQYASLLTESSGLANLWFHRKRTTTHEACSVTGEGVKAITINLLWPAFLLICIGFLLALIAFCVELIWFSQGKSGKIRSTISSKCDKI